MLQGRFIEEVKDMGIDQFTDSMVLSVSDDRVVTFVSPSLGFIRMKAGAVVLCTGCRERTRGALNIPGTHPADHVLREPRDSSTSKAICPERGSSSSAPETSD